MDPRTIELPTGARVSVIDTGAGADDSEMPAIVLLHGVCMSKAFFGRNIGPLAEAGHRVVALDYRGHGASPAAPSGHTVPQYARDVHALIDALGLGAVVLVGWSMGSMVAWDYLAQFPDDARVQGVAILSQGPSDLTQPGWDHGLATTAELREWVQAAQDDPAAFLAEFLPEMFMEEAPPEEAAALLASVAAIQPGTATSILADQTLADYRPVLPTFTTPHLLVWGRDEKIGQLAGATWVLDALPAAELHVFEHSGHCPMYEEPDAFNALLVEWIGRLGA